MGGKARARRTRAAGRRLVHLRLPRQRNRRAATRPRDCRLVHGDAPGRGEGRDRGRRPRGIVNRFIRDHDAVAPKAYPHVHYVTAPLRAAARAAGDAEGINLWAGQAYPLAETAPAASLVARWGAEAHALLRRNPRRVPRIMDEV